MLNSVNQTRQNKTANNTSRRIDSIRNRENTESILTIEKKNRQHQQLSNDNKLRKLDSEIDQEKNGEAKKQIKTNINNYIKEQ